MLNRSRASRAIVRNPSVSRSSRDTPTIRHPGMNPVRESWNRPGKSFRRDRSPVAPISTTTWEYFGATPAGILPTYPAPASNGHHGAHGLFLSEGGPDEPEEEARPHQGHRQREHP